jgi:hypothetical protein
MDGGLCMTDDFVAQAAKFKDNATKFENMKNRYIEQASESKEILAEFDKLVKDWREWRDNMDKTLMDRVKVISQRHRALIEKMDPFAFSGEKKNGNGNGGVYSHKIDAGLRDEILKEIYDKIMAGAEFNMTNLTDIYQARVTKNQMASIWTTLKKKPNIMLTRRGLNVYATAKKDLR